MKLDRKRLALTDLSYEDAKYLFSRGVKLYVSNTGPFGEDEGATVISFDPKDARVPEDYDEELGTPDEVSDIMVLSRDIGQSSLNWCEFDSMAEDVYAKLETNSTNESMSITEALRIVQSENFKVAKRN